MFPVHHLAGLAADHRGIGCLKFAHVFQGVRCHSNLDRSGPRPDQTLSVMIYKMLSVFQNGLCRDDRTISFVISIVLVLILLSKLVKGFIDMPKQKSTIRRNRKSFFIMLLLIAVSLVLLFPSYGW